MIVRKLMALIRENNKNRLFSDHMAEKFYVYLNILFRQGLGCPKNICICTEILRVHGIWVVTCGQQLQFTQKLKLRRMNVFRISSCTTSRRTGRSKRVDPLFFTQDLVICLQGIFNEVAFYDIDFLMV